MFKKILKILGWVLLAAFVGFTVWFINDQASHAVCKSVTVQMKPGSPRFLNETDILELVKSSDRMVLGKRLDQININDLERKLKEDKTIKEVQIFRNVSGKTLSFDGKLVLEVEQRNPVTRVQTIAEDFYLDNEGVKIPASSRFVVKVPLVNGSFTDDMITKDFLGFISLIYADPFWKAQIEQVFVNPNKDMVLIPQVGDQTIEFGTAEDYAEKFRNLKIVYQRGFSKTGWGKYKTINLKYKNQVVCVKK